MVQQNSAQFVALVKIRTGEPLTAIQIDEMIFGSISGYIGYYDLDQKKTSYFQPINEQIIRGIYSEKNKLYFAIGDRNVLIKYLGIKKDDQKINISRSHSNNICSHSMTMMYKMKQVIFCAFPTQKRQTTTTDLDQQKNNLYQIDIQGGEIKTDREFKIPDIYVPFDFDGKRILWMEYKADGKQFQCYDLSKKQVSVIKNFGNQYHFLSFGRIIDKDLIFIENNKNVKLLNTQNNSILSLYSHTSSIIAFDVAERESKYVRLISVDFNGVYKEWKNSSVIRTLNLWTVKNVPEVIKKHRYLFDMGYPYYLKVFGNVIGITTDLGLCIFRVQGMGKAK